MWSKFIGSEGEVALESFLRSTLNETKTILDLGCGTGASLEKILSLGLGYKTYLGIDFSPDMLEIAKSKFSHLSNVKFQQKDMTDMDDMSAPFDVVICTWALSHLEHPLRMVNQQQRLLSAQGNFFLMFVTKPAWYIYFWLFPVLRYICKVQCISEHEIKQFRNVKKRQSFFANMVTVILI